MKKRYSLLLIVPCLILVIACTKETSPKVFDATVKIDSVRQDSVEFGPDTIPGNISVYYTVENNGFDDIHSYEFTLNAKNVELDSYTHLEYSSTGVAGNTAKNGLVVMGIGKEAYLEVTTENIKFE